MFDIKTIGKKVIIQEIKEDETLNGKIIMPDSFEATESQAKVMSVGSDVKDVKVGNTVVYLTQAGYSFNYKKVTYKVLNEEQIIGILK